MKTIFSMGIIPDIDEVLDTVDAKVKFQNFKDEKETTLVCPVNIIDGTLKEQRKQCHKLVDDMFIAHNKNLLTKQ